MTLVVFEGAHGFPICINPDHVMMVDQKMAGPSLPLGGPAQPVLGESLIFMTYGCRAEVKGSPETVRKQLLFGEGHDDGGDGAGRG